MSPTAKFCGECGAEQRTSADSVIKALDAIDEVDLSINGVLRSALSAVSGVLSIIIGIRWSGLIAIFFVLPAIPILPSAWKQRFNKHSTSSSNYISGILTAVGIIAGIIGLFIWLVNLDDSMNA